MRLAILILTLTSLLLIWLFFPYQPAVVAGGSMEPVLHNHQIIVIQRNAYRHTQPAKGDIVVFRHEDEILVKRVFATQGDRVRLGAELVPNPNRNNEMKHWILRSKYLRIPRNEIFVSGENASSFDSWDFGPIPVDTVIGKVVLPNPPSSKHGWRWIVASRN